MKPVSLSYAAVNRIQMNYEIYGEGDPFVLILGGLTTVGEMRGWLQRLAKTRQVIGYRICQSKNSLAIAALQSSYDGNTPMKLV